jgi:hypothetical protein
MKRHTFTDTIFGLITRKKTHIYMYNFLADNKEKTHLEKQKFRGTFFG